MLSPQFSQTLLFLSACWWLLSQLCSCLSRYKSMFVALTVFSIMIELLTSNLRVVIFVALLNNSTIDSQSFFHRRTKPIFIHKPVLLDICIYSGDESLETSASPYISSRSLSQLVLNQSLNPAFSEWKIHYIPSQSLCVRPYSSPCSHSLWASPCPYLRLNWFQNSYIEAVSYTYSRFLSLQRWRDVWVLHRHTSNTLGFILVHM